MLTHDDIAYMRRTADEYDALLERWKHARAGSQEVANLHAAFKARGGEVGRMVENGLFHRVLASLDAGVKVLGEAEPLAAIRQAIADYHYALDTRQNGSVAAGNALARVCQALDMHWEQGAEAARRAAGVLASDRSQG